MYPLITLSRLRSQEGASAVAGALGGTGRAGGDLGTSLDSDSSVSGGLSGCKKSGTDSALALLNAREEAMFRWWVREDEETT
jgi:hypothetical protein